MIRGSALFAAVVAVSPLAGRAAHAERFDLLGCAGMELAQNAAPKEDAPDVNPNPQPDDRANGAGAQPPADNDDDDGVGSGSDQASPPDTAQPPGCIFQKGPLDLIV